MKRRAAGLHSETIGSGAGSDVVMLHGWAMHGRVWRDFAERLAHRARVTLIDLPGHGRSASITDFSLDSITAEFSRIAPPRAHWLGWSLGALLTLHMARRNPARVRSIALLAGSPYFVSGDRWPGVERAALRRVAEELRVDYLGTLKRFVVLQTLGSSDSKDLAKRLMVRIAEGERPDPGALAGGLRLLEQADLRDYLKYTAIPGLAILGGRDRLVPIALGAALSNIAPAMAVHVLPDAAHMPFATHAEDTSRLLLEFFDRHESRAEIRDERCLAR